MSYRLAARNSAAFQSRGSFRWSFLYAAQRTTERHEPDGTPAFGRGLTAAMLDASNVLVVLDQLDRTGLVVWLDGGWGVDALLGRHSRPHQDLNLVIARDDCAAAEAALAGMGFQHDLAAVPGWPAQLLLGDADGRRVDLHVVVFDGHGNGWQELGGGAWGGYPAEGLTGLGMVEGRQVRCLTPQPQGWSSPRLRWTPPTTTTWGCSPSGSGWRCHRASSLRRATTGQTVRRIRPEAAAD